MEEYLPVLNEKFEITGKALRKDCHYNPAGKLLHPVVHLHFLNFGEKLFLQLRPENKLIQPGKWDTSVGGHIEFGESVEDALARESYEEIGICALGASHVLSYVWETEAEKELVHVFLLFSEEVPTINSTEISRGKFWEIPKIREQIPEDIFTPNFIYEFRLLDEKNVFERKGKTYSSSSL